jgi:hypothetical protein
MTEREGIGQMPETSRPQRRLPIKLRQIQSKSRTNLPGLIDAHLASVPRSAGKGGVTGVGGSAASGRVPGEQHGQRRERHSVPGGAGQVSAPQPMRAFSIAQAARGPPGWICQAYPPTALPEAIL